MKETNKDENTKRQWLLTDAALCLRFSCSSSGAIFTRKADRLTRNREKRRDGERERERDNCPLMSLASTKSLTPG